MLHGGSFTIYYSDVMTGINVCMLCQEQYFER